MTEESFHAPDLTVGKRVTLRDKPCTVIGAVHYSQGEDTTWSSFLLQSGRENSWITVVEEHGGPETVAWHSVELEAGEPGDPSLEHDGLTYIRQDGGTARYRVEGAVDLPAEGVSEWHDYLVGKWRMSVERYDGGPWEASVGDVIPIGELIVGR